MIREALRLWGIATAPIHEIGHVIFGWISLNPAMIVEWNRVVAIRYGFTIQIGGYLFESIFAAGLSYRFRRKLWIHPITIWHVTSMFYGLTWQSDFPWPAVGPLLIWRLAGVLAYVIIVYSAISGGLAIFDRPPSNQHGS